jgi:hypothetical protein
MDSGVFSRDFQVVLFEFTESYQRGVLLLQ